MAASPCGNHLARAGRLARASALLLMHVAYITASSVVFHPRTTTTLVPSCRVCQSHQGHCFRSQSGRAAPQLGERTTLRQLTRISAAVLPPTVGSMTMSRSGVSTCHIGSARTGRIPCILARSRSGWYQRPKTRRHFEGRDTRMNLPAPSRGSNKKLADLARNKHRVQRVISGGPLLHLPREFPPVPRSSGP